MANTVLVVEDEKKLLYTLSDFLELNDYQVLRCDNGEAAVEVFQENMHRIDIVLLDIMLPGINGYQVLKQIRRLSQTPVIMLTAKDGEQDQVLGFTEGADDYITKPYSLAVIKAHVEAVLKRAGKLAETMESNGICLELASQKLFYKGNQIEITPKEFQLMRFFMENEGVVLSRDQILYAVWGYYYEGDIRTVDTLVKQLRKKMDNDVPIRSVYGVGYVFGGDK